MARGPSPDCSIPTQPPPIPSSHRAWPHPSGTSLSAAEFPITEAPVVPSMSVYVCTCLHSRAPCLLPSPHGASLSPLSLQALKVQIDPTESLTLLPLITPAGAPSPPGRQAEVTEVTLVVFALEEGNTMRKRSGCRKEGGPPEPQGAEGPAWRSRRSPHRPVHTVGSPRGRGPGSRAILQRGGAQGAAVICRQSRPAAERLQVML